MNLKLPSITWHWANIELIEFTELWDPVETRRCWWQRPWRIWAWQLSMVSSDWDYRVFHMHVRTGSTGGTGWNNRALFWSVNECIDERLALTCYIDLHTTTACLSRHAVKKGKKGKWYLSKQHLVSYSYYVCSAWTWRWSFPGGTAMHRLAPGFSAVAYESGLRQRPPLLFLLALISALSSFEYWSLVNYNKLVCFFFIAPM